ncbi:chromosome partitioning protein ParB [Amylibacter marinus]|uniref:Chromosome partitioning protein ParB n=1 Tax=Amylibacter marinus TaxID=1475483 RepID=A0ABQ5VY30_9RHOB|nr:ParB N-terminal domain-containing protein [Amylibacter marinus]GLQ36350.1 chromosome partitioning protein ParB [Amylibacter marinus]
MAKRRRLTAPDPKALEELETGFAAKPPIGLETKAMAPIAKVAGEAAALADPTPPESRAAALSDQADAERYRRAAAQGLVIEDIEISLINVDHIQRDRITDTEEARSELLASLRANGQRTPIEVVKTEEGYGLISGWRRLSAMIDLDYTHINALIRADEDRPEIYLNMIEENEIRASLSHYERGRIAVLATTQGVFTSIEGAVNHLFAAASKAKRSKIRKFAFLHEALGDLLEFPTALTEKTGLAIAAAVDEKSNLNRFRATLSYYDRRTEAEEASAIKKALIETKPKVADASKGGRPSTRKSLPNRTAKTGGIVTAVVTEQGFAVEVKHREVPQYLVEAVQREIARMLDEA